MDSWPNCLYFGTFVTPKLYWIQVHCITWHLRWVVLCTHLQIHTLGYFNEAIQWAEVHELFNLRLSTMQDISYFHCFPTGVQHLHSSAIKLALFISHFLVCNSCNDHLLNRHVIYKYHLCAQMSFIEKKKLS